MATRSKWFVALVLAAVLGVVQGPQAAFAGAPVGWNVEVINDPETEVSPAIAYNPDLEQYLVVWYNDRPGYDDIRAQRLRRNGQRVGGPFYISAEVADRRFPAVTYNTKAKQYLVVWQHDDPTFRTGIHGKRVSGTGQVLDANDIVIRSASYIYSAGPPAVAYASTADRYVVVWHESFHPGVTTGIFGQALMPDGSPDGGLFPIEEDPGTRPRTKPDLAYNRARNEFLVVWQQDVGGGDDDIYGRRVKMAGGAGPLGNPFAIAVDAKEQWNPAVAALPEPAGVGHYLVVWHHRHAPADGDIHARPVKGDGTLQPAYAVAEDRSDQSQPAVAGSEGGHLYLVTWHNATTSGFIIDSVRGREVSRADGPRGSDISCGGLVAANPAVAAGPLADFEVAFDDSLFVGNRGIYAQLWGNRGYMPMVLR